MRITTKGATSKTRRGWTDWLLVAASAGLCALAWRLVGDVQRLRDENESDVRTLRDEYARLERERAELHRQLTSVNERLATLEAVPAPIAPGTSLPTPSAAPIALVNETQDAISEASMGNTAEIQGVRAPRRPRSTPTTNGTSAGAQSTPRKPRTRKSPPQAGGEIGQNGAAPS